MNSLNIRSFPSIPRSLCTALIISCIAFALSGSACAQSPAAAGDAPPQQPIYFSQSNQAAPSIPNQSSYPATPSTAGQGQDLDISSSKPIESRQQYLRPQPFKPQPLSEFQQIIRDSTGRTLPIFGSNLFDTVPSTFAPVDNIPVAPDYVIGPGDELRIQIWGQVNQHGSFIVDRTGSIALPQVGSVHVAGLSYSQLNEFLKAQLARIYRNFDVNVNLGQLRSIQVFVVGQARRPATYTISSLSTLLNAVFASGGPLSQGSLRDIQLKRGTETIVHFDLYDLLLRGDKSKDVKLEPGDVIFIPKVGPQVAVLGSVTNPAVYELRDETRFRDVVALAGGLTNTAVGSQLRVERISNHSQRSELDISLETENTPPVQDGDIISVNPVIDRFHNAVTLRGNVANPGRVEWHPGMRISDLIPNSEMLVTRQYYRALDKLGQTKPELSNTDLAGTNGTSGSPSNGTMPLSNPNEANSNSSSEIISPNTGDRSRFPQGNLEVQSSPSRSTNGAGLGRQTLGTALLDNNGPFTATNDVLLSAPDIDWDYAVIERQNAGDLTTSLLPFNLGKAILKKDPTQNLELRAGDVVTIFSKADIRVPSAKQTKFVKLEGEFEASGIYSVLPGETLRQLLVRAGGLSPDAYLFASSFTRESVRRIQQQRIQEYADTLESQIAATSAASAASALTDRDAAASQASAAAARTAVENLRRAQPSGRIVLNLQPDSTGIDAIPDIELQDGDRFLVPRTPATITVQGQVYSANAFLYKDGLRVKDYLRIAGGPDRIADQKREYILRADGSVVSRQSSGLARRALFADADFGHQPIFPGDTIIVPPIIEKGAIMREILNISTIVQGFGIGAAAIQVLK
ncbi:MAG TPA: SLBB domain-containing protein [Acidobacteriaceae bacterium]|nr:SLBB domain-containing protein [Acidobacteriaceae bacterium]